MVVLQTPSRMSTLGRTWKVGDSSRMGGLRFSGESSYQWNGGMPQCASCSSVLANRYASRCKSCAQKHRWDVAGRKKHRRYIHQVDKAKYAAWRCAVFKRDDYTCLSCHKKGGSLEAHHIKAWATNEELRYCVDNGSTMCFACHKAFHGLTKKSQE